MGTGTSPVATNAAMDTFDFQNPNVISPLCDDCIFEITATDTTGCSLTDLASMTVDTMGGHGVFFLLLVLQ